LLGYGEGFRETRSRSNVNRVIRDKHSRLIGRVRGPHLHRSSPLSDPLSCLQNCIPVETSGYFFKRQVRIRASVVSRTPYADFLSRRTGGHAESPRPLNSRGTSGTCMATEMLPGKWLKAIGLQHRDGARSSACCLLSSTEWDSLYTVRRRKESAWST